MRRQLAVARRIRQGGLITSAFVCGVLLPCILTFSVNAPAGQRDPEFSRLPFQQWLAQGEQPGVGWSAEILPAEISVHQRLLLRVVIRVDGLALAKHRGSGEFVTLVQYKDKDGELWQNHTSLDLSKLPAGIETHQTAIAQYAFVLPGDYSLAIAVSYTGSLEHGLILRQVHAEPLKADPLPEAWKGLPAVEFIPSTPDPPDVWYLPGVEHRMNLNLNTRRRVHLKLLVNTTPSMASSIAAMRANMSVVIPALKVLSQIDVHNGSTDVAFLDLPARRVSFEQRNFSRLAWDGIRKIFLDPRLEIISARDLEKQSEIKQFFRDEVSRRLDPGPPQPGGAEFPVVIILSGPAFLQDRTVLGPPDKRPDQDHLLYYIRFVTSAAPSPVRRKRRGARHAPPAPVPEDDLQRAVEPYNDQRYDATSVQQFRVILADVLKRLSRI